MTHTSSIAGGHIDVLELLVAAGCKTALTDDLGKTGWDLALAAGSSRHEVVRCLQQLADDGNKTLALESQARASGMPTVVGRVTKSGKAGRSSKRVSGVNFSLLSDIPSRCTPSYLRDCSRLRLINGLSDRANTVVVGRSPGHQRC